MEVSSGAVEVLAFVKDMDLWICNLGYVGDHVAVSRTFGNITYQSGEKVKGIINEPYVYKVEIDDEEDFLILASDGIWDPLKDQFAVTHARRALRTTEQPEDAAKQWAKMPRKSAQLTTQLP
ncbi:unnamed protein product [Symbiodinium pilosum]|uniref:PPM-type phosphatase domain-containing protein n=1 Tax=Symbiodinium pilosum TaxID=2952 RepID=A0A812W6D6_SYMPI|nr:unnamed protein product [Symbiodinium pilosum]